MMGRSEETASELRCRITNDDVKLEKRVVKKSTWIGNNLRAEL